MFFLSKTDDGTGLKKCKKTIKDPTKASTEWKRHSTPHDPKSRGAELNNHQDGSTTQSQSWAGRQYSSPQQEALPRVPSCPSQINSDSSSHMPKQHITSFAELARCKKGGGDSSLMENSMEAPTCSKFAQKTSPVQRKASQGKNIALIASVETLQSSEVFEPASQSGGKQVFYFTVLNTSFLKEHWKC